MRREMCKYLKVNSLIELKMKLFEMINGELGFSNIHLVQLAVVSNHRDQGFPLETDVPSFFVINDVYKAKLSSSSSSSPSFFFRFLFFPLSLSASSLHYVIVTHSSLLLSAIKNLKIIPIFKQYYGAKISITRTSLSSSI